MLLPNRKSSGFSLVELMITVALLGILSTFAVSSYKSWIQNSKIRNAAESIQSGIQIARGEAVSRNVAVELTLGANSAWTVGCVTAVADNDGDGVADCPADIQSRTASEGSSADITVTPSVAGPYVFSSLGVMTSPAPGVGGFVNIDVDINTAVLSAAESRELRVVIALGGSVRTCDPALPTAGTDPRKCPV